MANGQVTTSGQGSIVKGVSLALLGLALASGVGTMSASGSDGAFLLSGQASTTASGTLSQGADPTLTGQSSNASQGILSGSGRSLLQSASGIVVQSSAVPLVGSVSAVGQGLISPNADGTVPLIGTASVSATGLLTTPGIVPLAGSASTSSPGTLGLTLRPTDIVGQALVSATGLLSIEANNVTVHITQSAILSAAGFVDSRPIITGQVSTSAAGIVGYTEAFPIVGSALVSSHGTLSANQGPSEDTYILSQSGEIGRAETVLLTGSESATAAGSLAIGFDVFQPITGSETTVASGTAGVVQEIPLIGNTIASAQESLGAPGFGVLSGLAITSQQGTLYLNDDRARALLSSASTMTIGTLAPTIRPALTGQNQSVSAGQLGRIGGNMQQALTGQSSTWNMGTLMPSGGDDVETTATNEGCSVVSAVAEETEVSPSAQGAEGCFVLAGTAREV